MSILKLENRIQNYAWGSTIYIAKLQGRYFPSEQPEAEVWMGTHPKAPSLVAGQSLQDLIASDPIKYLGESVASRYQNKLPFLLKFLAAGQPLSIQAHPNIDQARKGFVRENRQGISLTASHRNYKDDNHKPEIICALSEFWVLNGFRPIPRILKLMEEASLTEIYNERCALAKKPNRSGLNTFFLSIMKLDDKRCERLLDQLQQAPVEKFRRRPEYDWIVKISELYPGDICVICVLLLNLVKLQPGEAMFVANGYLHAYLEGFGVELITNSDNVLRGGLTAKHIDRLELTSILTFRTVKPKILKPKNGVYSTPVDEFVLEVIHLEERKTYESADQHGFELLASARGKAAIQDINGKNSFVLKTGQACAVTALAGRYRLQGNALIYKASVKGACR